MRQKTTESPNRKLPRIKQVEELTSLHRQSIWRKVKAKTFPKPRKLGVLNVWPEGEIQAWLEGVIQSIDQAAVEGKEVT